jgi:hypothetical protein
MPPADAVKAGTVKPLNDEDKFTLVRWIDLGCPIDLPRDPKAKEDRGGGWFLDDQRPTLALTEPRAGKNGSLTRILIGAHDCGTGLDLNSLSVIADFDLDGVKAGENLAAKLTPTSQGAWELKLKTPVVELAAGRLTVSVKDREGNTTRIERTFSISEPKR